MCRLVLVGAVDTDKGGGGEEYAIRLRALDNNIVFIPPVYNPKDLAGIMKGADCFVYPSIAVKGEAFGVAPLEAMACGLPTIVSDLECFLDYGKPEKNILVFRRGPDASANLAVQIKRIMQDSELRERLGRNAAETARRFSTERIAALYHERFRSLLEE
jgi:glycosyltransferase involved in cell wall biosynthesis